MPAPAPAAEPFARDRALARLASESFDVLVIGGGITGAGVALDAASRGLKTALVERDDFASGTSSKSSKLIHGGLRYLQQHEYRLVYENLAERQRLLDNAPHLVAPLPFLIPLFGKPGVVNKSVARVYRTALWLYDLTGGVRIGRRHEKVTREQALAHMPTLRADRLAAGFLYWDARSDDSRLTLTVLRTAVLGHGATAVNHTPVTGLVTDATGRVRGATVTPAGGEPFDVRASVVINAAGVWSDEVRTLDEHHDPHSIRPAKGIHITVPEEAFPCDIAAVIPVREDKRSIFVVSWGDQVYLGTTDTAWDGPLDDPSCTPEDVDYILGAANAVSTRQLTRADITGIWSGLRPLLAPEQKGAVERADRRPVAPPHGAHLGQRDGERDRRQADHLPQDGRGHGRRGGRGAGSAGTALPHQEPPAPRSPTGWTGDTPGRRGRGQRPLGPRPPRGVAGHPPGRSLRHRGPGGPGHGRGAARTARAAGRGSPLPDGRSPVGRTPRDGRHRRRRAGPPHPVGLPGRPGDGRGRHKVAALIGPELGWDDERRRTEADAYAARLRADLARAGLDPDPVGRAGTEAGAARDAPASATASVES